MFEKEISERLKELWKGGLTQDELSRKTGISRSYLGHILSGKQPVKNPTIDLLLKVFPRATVNLTGDVRQINTGQSGGVNAQNINGHNFFAADRTAAVSDYRLKAMDAVLALDLPPDAMQAILRALKEIK